MTRTLFNDDRPDRGALAFHIVIMLGGLVFAGVLYILLEPIGEEYLQMAANGTTSQAAQDGQEYTKLAWQNAHFIVLGLSVLQLIVAATYEARVDR